MSDDGRLHKIADEIVRRTLVAVDQGASIGLDVGTSETLAHHMGTVCQEAYNRGELTKREVKAVIDLVGFKLKAPI